MSKYLCQCIMMLIYNMLIACQGGSDNSVPAQNTESQKNVKKNNGNDIPLVPHSSFAV